MNSFFYEVPLLQQGLQECAQASAAQILQYYKKSKSVEDVCEELPVYRDKEGTPLGTSLGHIAAYFIQQGFRTTIHTTDIQIFDQSWRTFSRGSLIKHLLQRKQYIKHPVYTAEIFDVIFDGYISFLQLGGTVLFPLIDEHYLITLLAKGPIYAVVSYNFFNSIAKYSYSEAEERFVPNSTEGTPSTHSVIIAGYNERRFYVVDPDCEYGGNKWVDTGHMIASLYLAQTDDDNVLITLER